MGGCLSRQHSGRTSTPPVSMHATPSLVQAALVPATVEEATSVVRELIDATTDASEMYKPFQAALRLLMEVWNVYSRTMKCHPEFISLATKLAVLNTLVTTYKTLEVASVQKRLEAIATAVNQLAESMREKKERRILNHVLQSTEDDKIVETMFCYVALLLEVFQSGTNEMALVAITHRLDTAEQHSLTSLDAVEIINALADQQYSTILERCQAILDHLQRRGPVGGSETVINSNSNQNELVGLADFENNNANETELEIEGRGGGVVNNNSNVNRMTGNGAFSPESGESIPLHPTRITNNNGNKNHVRRTVGR